MRKTINVNKLLLDVNNSRFPDLADNQRDAISTMLEIQSDKIINLAKDIAIKGLDPSENILVHESEDEPGFYIVDEGNRRVTALKLLLSPELAPNEKIKKIFEKIQPTVSSNISIVDNCMVFKDDSYTHWVNIKHTGQNQGIGRVDWTAPEKARHMARNGKLSFGHQILENIGINYSDNIKNKCKKHIKITNITRLFGDPNIRNAMNIDVIDGFLYCKQPHSRFLEQLSKIINSMIEEDERGKSLFTVNQIRHKTDRAQFIIDVGISSSTTLVPKPWRIIDEKNKDNPKEKDGSGGYEPEPLISSPVPLSPEPTKIKLDVPDEPTEKPTGTGAVPGDETKTTRPPTSNRNNLIPTNVRLNFKTHKKCSRIYTELKKHLTFDDSPISISVMLRIFIDLSVTIFAEENKLTREFKKQNKGREPGLHDKVVICAHFLQENNNLTGYEAKAVMAASNQITKANGTLQQYVHNPSFLPTKEAVNTEWDNFQRLLEEIWK